MKILVLGIGNSILGDDGVGVFVAQELQLRIREKDIDITHVNVDGLNLLEIITGYEKLIVIDAIMTENGDIGDIYRLVPEQVCQPSDSNVSPHHLNLATTLEIGRNLFPDDIPEEVTIYAVKVNDVTSVGEEMTAEVKEAIPTVVRLITEELSNAEAINRSSNDRLCLTG